MMFCRGIRGATTASDDTPEAIKMATKELLKAMIDANDIQEEQVASVIFTTTPDLTAAFPASAARALGWTHTALMGSQEVAVPGALPMCIRILIHWNTTKEQTEIHHIFLGGATQLRPDLTQDNATKPNGGHNV
jgi:chorismate mutase